MYIKEYKQVRCILNVYHFRGLLISFFSVHFFQKKNISGIPSVCQTVWIQKCIGPGLDLNCLQRLSAQFAILTYKLEGFLSSDCL